MKYRLNNIDTVPYSLLNYGSQNGTRRDVTYERKDT